MNQEALQFLTMMTVEAIENLRLPFTRWHCLLYRHVWQRCLQLAVFASRAGSSGLGETALTERHFLLFISMSLLTWIFPPYPTHSFAQRGEENKIWVRKV